MHFGLLAAAALLYAHTVTAQAVSSPVESAPQTAPATTPGLPRSYPFVNGTLVVAPGLPLPNGNLPWALDAMGDKQALIPLHHATLNEAAAGAQTAELAGPRSTNGLHQSVPVIFIHTSERTENTRDQGRPLQRPLWLLLRAEVQGAGRSVRRPTPDQIRSSTGCVPSSVCLTADPLADGWIRMVPNEPLAPGEYVLVPVVRPARSAVEVVYDFTIDPAAPMDRDAVLPGADLRPKKKAH